MSVDEKDIVKKASLGDHAAFEQIVNLYEKKVYNIALRYCNNSHDAMDISQEVFLRVYRFLPKFNGESQFSTWIYRITMNVCHDLVGKKNNITELSLDGKNEDDEDYQVEVSDERFSPEKQLEQKELRETIKKGIATLDESYRDAVIMRDVNGLAYEDIADILQVSVGTVKSRIARGREKLRKFLCEHGNFFEKIESNNKENARKEELP